MYDLAFVHIMYKIIYVRTRILCRLYHPVCRLPFACQFARFQLVCSQDALALKRRWSTECTPSTGSRVFFVVSTEDITYTHTHESHGELVTLNQVVVRVLGTLACVTCTRNLWPMIRRCRCVSHPSPARVHRHTHGSFGGGWPDGIDDDDDMGSDQ